MTRSKVEKALWFAETYGLTLKSVVLESNTGDASLNFKYSENGCDKENQAATDQDNPLDTDTNEKLDEEDIEKLKTILYIMDRFSISIDGYHELAQVEKSLPRVSHLEDLAKHLNSSWTVTRTPGIAPGSELPIRILLENEIRKHIPPGGTVPNKVKVKLSGYGVVMSHSKSLFVFTFALLDMEENILSSAGNHTVALIMAGEDYGTLEESLANVIRDVTALMNKGIEINGASIQIEFFLGGDYKYILNIMGMKSANSNNSCVYCKIDRLDRCRMDFSREHVEGPQMRRELGSDWHKQPGCSHQPLFPIPLSHVIIDELHLLLRVMDRLEGGIIYEVMKWDQDDTKNKTAGYVKGQHLRDLLETVRSFGVTLAVWQEPGKKELDWTSLLGDEKKALLKKLPQYFGRVLPPRSVEATTKLWVDFQDLYWRLNHTEPTQANVTEFEQKAKQWGIQLTRMTGPGYKHEVIVTPYIHLMIFHVGKIMTMHGSLRNFSGQGVEKKNDDFRRFFHRKINRWDPATNLLLVEKRQEALREYQRTKRPYNKHNDAFWIGGGKQESARKVTRISTSLPATPPSTSQAPPTSTTPCNYTQDELAKLSVPRLIAIYKQLSGKVINRRATRKQVLIADLLALRAS